ncbi:MAG: selenide, water dikinase SelD [Sediminibacterium sp.]|nr:selenide, water dikinase SelD [Sediminibacterium sp.]
MQDIKLTQYSKASGCGCKIAPAVLKELLKTDFQYHDPGLIVGNATSDDAAVYDIGNGTLVISTTDFFMPIVDDAFDFGRVSACNALSDVYAMGGKPVMAIAILGWPTEKLKPELAARVLDGARHICKEAGISLAGGHSIESTEPFFGLAVTGTMPKAHLKQNHTIEPGDKVYLSKPIGTGILSTAMKRSCIVDADYNELVSTMCTLNRLGGEMGALPYVTAITDVTGFGLAGHALEMIGEKPLNLVIEKVKVPLLTNVLNYQQQFIYPDNTTRNYNAFASRINGMTDLDFILYCDPQTSGGLLFSVRASEENNFNNWVKQMGFIAYQIGHVSENQDGIPGFLTFF